MTDKPTVREIAALTARLRDLTRPGAVADDAARAEFLADKEALLARIATNEEEQERAEQLAIWHIDDTTTETGDYREPT
ncbi:hypothetical protein [Pseudonocardia broussonetiae]|uniref:Uncharacterized protein n=1 Tax=Pseudonocardia broussonetiae TaxID=2736640 RepID=A0A6M6JAC7_9PSEU|nr:hypothetical protein [Pseudonocardia broussonetiae]QJY44808.1 hypothetical protein HOP40_02260 [Pseudonocardia broussonetiae]